MTKIGKIVVDRDTCIGSANCVAVLPEVMDLDDEGKATVKLGVSLDDVVRVLDAAKSCPVQAIAVYDEAGKQVWPEPTA